jgi:hypothetical protein
MSENPRATSLSEVSSAVDLEPLKWDDKRYVEISAGRGTDQLKELRLCLLNYSAARDRFAKITLIGHRGCGKSTELLKLEHDVRDQFTSLHIYADESLIGDYEYSDLFLWLVDELVKKFCADEIPLNQQIVGDVISWFAEVTTETEENTESRIALETEAEFQAKYGVFGTGLKVLARLKSMVIGSNLKRKKIRAELQNYPLELIRKIDTLFDHAHDVLRKNGKPADLLIVVDNLDRLKREISQPLFFEKGDLLKRPRAHFIYTVPIAAVHAPENISTIFEKSFVLPMVKVRDQKGKVQSAGVKALLAILESRLEIESIFSSPRVARTLVEKSGGSIRELLRLIGYAELAARVYEKSKIDNESAKRACSDLRLDLERHLIPRQLFFPLLAQIHLTKGDGYNKKVDAEDSEVQKYIDRFLSLLNSGVVLEYNGADYWFDVIPVIEEIDAFKKALANAQSTPHLEKSPD